MPMDGQDDTPVQGNFELDDPEGDAAFAAGFNTTREQSHGEATTSNTATHAGTASTERQPVDALPADSEAAAAVEAAAQAAAEAERAAAEASTPVTLTRAEVDAMRAQLARVQQLEQQVQHTRDSTAGSIGSLKQTIDALKAQATQGKPFSAKQLTRLKAEFPEMHDMLLEDLTDAFGGAGGDAPAPGADADQRTPAGNDGTANGHAPAAPVDPLNNPEVVKVLQQKEMTIVDAIHPGWRGSKDAAGNHVPGLIDTPAFQEWRSSLPAAAQSLLASTWDHSVLKDAIAGFKAWEQQRATQAQARADTNKQRDQRLANAVPATTGAPTGAHAIDDDTAFLSGFQKARGRG